MSSRGLRPSVRRAAILALVLAAALAGCVSPDVDKSAITDYLNAGTTDRAIDCPFLADDAAKEGIVDAPEARDLAVTPDARLLLAEPDRIRVVSTNYTTVDTWPLPTSTPDVRVDAGSDLVAAIQDRGVGKARVTTFQLDGTQVASRNVSANWQAGLSVHDGQIALLSDRAGGASFVDLAENLTVQRRVDLREPASAVRDLADCDRTTYALTGVGSGADVALRAFDPETGNASTTATVDHARHLAVGQELALVAGGDGAKRYLRVLTLDGDKLLRIDNAEGRSYGRFAVAHDLVYNLRGDTVLVRPVADFLTRPS